MRARASFARFIAIDWSGARLPSAQRRAIVRCVVEGGGGAPRVTALAWGFDRPEIVAWLADRAEDGVRTLVGLDFPFAYARPFLDHLGVPDFAALLGYMVSVAMPAEIETHIERCGSWWAECGARQDHRTRRLVERLPPTWRAESPLRALRDGFVGPRQVGKAAITGLAAIAALRTRAPAVRVWPFESPADASLVLAEIWPRLALQGVVKSDAAARRRYVRGLARQGIQLRRTHRRLAEASDHAIDALAAGIEMASGDWPLLDRETLPPEAIREGWILGVEPPGAPPATSPRTRSRADSEGIPRGPAPPGAASGQSGRSPARAVPRTA
jgi:hypothetical protein